MEGCDGNLDGSPGDLTFRRYRRFGESGAKLIWFEACAVAEEGRANPRRLWIHRASVSALKRLLAVCRQAHRERYGSLDGLVTVLQLTHSGRYASPKPLVAYPHPVLDRWPTVGPVSAPPRATPPQVTGDEHLEALEDKFAEASAWAREIGFDGVDLKMTHGYLLSELLSARARPGSYGGDLSGRATFAVRTLQKIRQRAGKDFLLADRLGVYDGVPYCTSDGKAEGVPRDFPRPYQFGSGVRAENPLHMDLSEPLRFIGHLRDAGLGLLNVSMGIPYANPHLSRPYEKPNEGVYETPEHPLLGVARHFKAQAVIQEAYPDLAVVGAGYSWLQHFLIHAAAANLMLMLRRIKFVGLGRAALAYPWLAREALEKGEINPLQTCKTLSFCTYLMRSKNHPLGQFPAGCPPFDKDPYGQIVKEARHAARKN